MVDVYARENFAAAPLEVNLFSWLSNKTHSRRRTVFRLFIKVFFLCSVSIFCIAITTLPAVAADSDGFRYPLLDGTTELQINRDFGEGGVGGHLGQDYAAAFGGPVLAASNGKVVYSYFSETDNYNDGWGNTVVIEHTNPALPGGKIYSHYSHLSRVDVAVGDEVSKGQVIGAVGSTGDSGGPHLHFEIKSGSKLGDGYTRSDFYGNSLDYDGMTYYRPSWFVETYRVLTPRSSRNALAGKTLRRGEWSVSYAPDSSVGIVYGFSKGDRVSEVGFKTVPGQVATGNISAYRVYNTPVASVAFDYEQDFKPTDLELEVKADGIVKKKLAFDGRHSERIFIEGLHANRIEFTWKALQERSEKEEAFARISGFKAVPVGSTLSAMAVNGKANARRVNSKAPSLSKDPDLYYVAASVLILAVGIAGGGCLYRIRRRT